MEAFMLVDDDVLAFEPLASSIHINELYIGAKSIFHETLENLWQSGIQRLTLVVEKHRASQFYNYRRRFNFGRRDGYVDVVILALNVDKIMPGTALREICSIFDQLDDFILMYWDTLLAVPLYDALEIHRTRRKESPHYAMSAIYIEDSQQRSFSDVRDDCMMLFDGNYELLAYQRGTDKMRLTHECLQKLNGESDALSIRYDLCKTGIYICNKAVAEHYTNWFEHAEIDEYILDCLGREFKTDEIYITILQHDVIFPNFPPALRVRTPKDYHNVYMEYITRFQEKQPVNQKQVTNYQPRFGPMVREDATFVNNSALVPPFNDATHLFTSVFHSIVGQKVTVGSDTTVERCIIFDNVTIGNNCSLKDSIIMEGVRIADDTALPPGSIICSGTDITPSLVDGLSGSFRASRVPSKYIDLTEEAHTEGNHVEHQVYIWPINAIDDMESTYIGRSYYDVMKVKPPTMDSSTEFESDELEGAEIYSDVSEWDSSEIRSEADFEVSSDDKGEKAEEVHTAIDSEIVDELKALTYECLENPNLLPNKVLEIKSLKISHDLQRGDMVKIAFEFGLCWIISRFKDDEDDLQELMEKSQFKEFLESFDYRMVEEEHYADIMRVCTDMKRDIDFFSQMCEALYQVEIMEFEGLQAWLLGNGVAGKRINSFAEWIADE